MKIYQFFRKYHKWLGVVLSILLILFAVSGIILNHRQFLAKYSVSRNYLPKEYRYDKWNNALIREMIPISSDTVLFYGNAGVWVSDSSMNKFSDMNSGFPDGIDSRKIFKVVEHQNNYYAGTLFGLYKYNDINKRWYQLILPVKDQNVMDLLSKGDSLFALTRSDLLLSVNQGDFVEKTLPIPENYDNKVSLFKTMWVVHNGEVFGKIGMYAADALGYILVFLTVTGLILFFNKNKFKNKSIRLHIRRRLRKQYQWNLKWHNRVGWTMALFLLISTLTGMFLRPPLLIPIAKSRVAKIPKSELAHVSPWYDIMRRVHFVSDENRYVFSTTDGFYYSNDELQTIHKFDSQPPASVMGVTVLETTDQSVLRVGSFEGLFDWNYQSGYIYDVLKKEEYIPPKIAGPPVGDYKVVGYGFDREGNKLVFDYILGSIGVEGNEIDFPEMPHEMLRKSPLSLWSLALEVHTGRILQFMLGPFYVLLVPLTGLFALFIIISGFVIWFKYHRKRKK